MDEPKEILPPELKSTNETIKALKQIKYCGRLTVVFELHQGGVRDVKPDLAPNDEKKEETRIPG